MTYRLIKLWENGASASPVCDGSLREVAKAGLAFGLSSLLAVRRFPELDDMGSEEMSIVRASTILVLEGVDEKRIQDVLQQLNNVLRGLEQPTYVVVEP